MLKIECNYDYIPNDQTGHTHGYAHIFIPTSDILYIRIDETDFWLNANSIAYVHAEMFHRVICTKKVIWLSIPDEMINYDEVEELIHSPIFSMPEYLHNLVDLFRYEAIHDPTGRCVQYLFQYLYSKMIMEHKYASIQFLEAHYTEPITIELLAHIENYNPNYYITWFRNHMGKTPNEYLTELRINKAKELLIHTRYRVIDIALQIGYTNASSFSRAFRTITGSRPLDFRNSGKHMLKFSELPYWEND